MLRLSLLIMLISALVHGCDSGEAARPASPESPQLGTDAASVTQPASDHREPTLRVAEDGPPGSPVERQPAKDGQRGAPATTAATQSGEADTRPAFRPLADARVGEWATYSAVNGQTVRYEVLGVADEVVRIRVEVRDGGKIVGMPATREERRDFNPLAKVAPVEGGTRTATPAQIEAAGRMWEATLWEDRWTSEEIKYVRKTWVSEVAPVFGTVRMELTGAGTLEAKLELTAFASGTAR